MTQIHVSWINAYQTCPRMYYFAYVERLVPVVESPKLLFGKGIHKGLEAYYKTSLREEALAAYRQWLAEQEAYLMENNADPEHVKEASEIGELLLGVYIDYAEKKDNFKAVAVEQEFVAPIWPPDGSPLEHQHAGRWDGVVRNMYGDLWLMEHKTARDFPTEIELQLNPQVSYYLLAAQQLYDEPVRGVVYNVIRKVHPARARSPVIFRRLITRTAVELKHAQEQLYRATVRMLSDEHFDPIPGFHCSWKCAYQQLCLCLQDGTDYQPLAEQMFRVREETVLEVSDEAA